jgi:hypothetical protein
VGIDAIGEPLIKRTMHQTRYVYFVRAATIGLIKIGSANDPRARLKDLSHSSPDRLELIGLYLCQNRGLIELELHKTFAAHRAHGEWFKPDSAILSWVRKHAAGEQFYMAELQAVMDRPTMKVGRPRGPAQNKNRTLPEKL